MVSVGGARATNQTTGPCDWQTKGINVFEISNITWSSKYTKIIGDYQVPNAVFPRIGGNAQENATMTAPAEGFDESRIAALFCSAAIAASPAKPSPICRWKGAAHNRRITIASATTGGTVLLSLTMWCSQRSLPRVLVGDLNERLEMDGKARHNSELPGNAVFWELPGAGPADLWSPTVSPMLPKVEDEFKFETKRDREFGW
ncbi:MAG: hypothetical protein Q9188_000733 [Gyalolechia gomerana]